MCFEIMLENLDFVLFGFLLNGVFLLGFLDWKKMFFSDWGCWEVNCLCFWLVDSLLVFVELNVVMKILEDFWIDNDDDWV